MSRPFRAFLLTALLGLLLASLASSASAAEQKLTFKHGPIEVDGYQVKQSDLDIGIPKPSFDGNITGMEVDIVDQEGTKVPIQRLMLHHVVFSTVGANFGDKRDATCGQFTNLDSKSKLPAVAERFYAAGEERAVLKLPEGYGYPVKGADQWVMTWMVMNHRPVKDKAYVQYTITYDTEPKTPVRPVWLDVKNCLADPIYSVLGGGKRGSTDTRRATWTVPDDGRIVAGGGHVHGGAKNLALTQPDCSGRSLIDSRPLWGNRDHPFYNVYPILHEPGPINMSGSITKQGFAVKKGEKLRLASNYDNQLPHTRVMGIMLIYMAPPDGERTGACAPLPGDVQIYKSNQPGRTRPPRFEVPIIGLGRNGKAREIDKAPGGTSTMRRGGTVSAQDFYFNKPNVVVDQGARLKWLFKGDTLHNITLANGPQGFASQHLSQGRVYSKRFTKAGKYQMFCGLHPVEMTQTVTVKKKRR